MTSVLIYLVIACVITIIVLWYIVKKKTSLIEHVESRCEVLSSEKKEWMDRYIKQKQITETKLEDLKKERRDFESMRNAELARIEISKHEAERELEGLAARKREEDRIMAYKEEALKMDYHRLESSLRAKYLELENDCKRKEEDFNLKQAEILEAMSNKSPFLHVAEMFSNFKACIFDDVERYLISRSAPKSAETVKEMKKKYTETLCQYKDIQYKYTFLLNVFPELKDYTEDEESITHLTDLKNYDEFAEEYDRVRLWLSKEEYESLSVVERNQLALDRYNARRKSKLEVGLEYEMYIGYLLRQVNFHTIQYGIENGVNDLGRDIIAERAHLDGSRTIYIIQCKRWAANRPLHENVICQLFGTKVEYEINHKHFLNTKFIPVLVTTTELSKTARDFAKCLGVLIKIVPMGDYPKIKCNINNNEKIYHLPFDQQYNRTIISNEGEFYAMTVEEAENAGFRRARRYRHH